MEGHKNYQEAASSRIESLLILEKTMLIRPLSSANSVCREGVRYLSGMHRERMRSKSHKLQQGKF